MVQAAYFQISIAYGTADASADNGVDAFIAIAQIIFTGSDGGANLLLLAVNIAS